MASSTKRRLESSLASSLSTEGRAQKSKLASRCGRLPHIGDRFHLPRLGTRA